ncbi:radical SAM protein [Zhenpiania hominis]|uniref:radical SAM protein n=1 Tax=Zhenpiania hominis TaxID=2763644 RepID=UPI0039F57E1B
MKRIMLIITGACNLKCTYCYERLKDNKIMTFGIAKQIIDNTIAGNMNEKIIIEYFGGEPLLNFSLIVQLEEYLNEHYHDRDIRFFITTNGTVLNDSIKDWLYRHREKYTVNLSLDGKKNNHNMIRKFKDGSDSYDSIDVDFFKETWEKCSVNLTVAPQTLDTFYENVVWVEEQGFICQAGFALGVDWNSINYKKILAKQLEQLREYYIRHPKRGLCLALRYDLRELLKKDNKEYLPCGVGTFATCFDTDGRKYPCNGFSHLVFSNENIEQRSFQLKPENICYSCKFKRLCKTCFAANYYLYGNMQKQSDEVCDINRMCIITSYLIQKERNNILYHYTEEELYYISKIVDENRSSG